VQLPPFQTLVDRHAAELHRFLVALVGIPDADDCLQETLMAALRTYPGLTDASNLRAWLFTIAQRKATDAVRRSRRRPTVALDGHDSPVDPHDMTDEALWRAVRGLPPRQRAAVVHRFVFDLAYRQIGERLGCTEVAARRSVHDGLASLRRVVDR